jgi:hypothetical protein
VARFGHEPGERGTLETRVTEDGSILGFFVPSVRPAAGTDAAARLTSGVKLLEAVPSESRLTIFPTDTRPWSNSFLASKYSQIATLVLPVHVDSDPDISSVLEELPSGFTKDYEYGLGLARECDALIDLIEEYTSCSEMRFVASGDPSIDGPTFRISFSRFDAIRAEFARIKSRGDLGIRRAKETYVHNDLAKTLSLDPRQLSLGRLPITKWLTGVAAGAVTLSDAEQDELLTVTPAGIAEMASKVPAKIARLQRDVEVANLDQLIASYEQALDIAHDENWWQLFFEANVFVLQLLFGGPTMFVGAQVRVGEGDNAAKGKKIADYLLKNPMTNNACLVEIKRPNTTLLKRSPYRQGVFGVHSEIGEAVTQVLDQALQLTQHEADTRARTGDSSWVATAPRCFVVVGRALELETGEKRRSFDLYREHLSGVRLVTYDEILQQLITLREYLVSEAKK